ncbi:MAG: flagellar hook-associated protein FlgK [Roseburia sp.]|nr:flagellar hook-associated protein FlgK [Roseburia sp.]
MPSQFFGLNIASSGLSAYQAALNTTANNISNVKTEGYTRQVANMSSSAALRVHAKYGSAGTGVQVDSVKQVRNEYYDTKFWENQSALGLYETKLNYNLQIENYFIDDDTEKGFSTILNNMFNAMDTLKNSAGDVNNRQQFIAQAKNFTTYFNSVAIGLGQIQDSVNEEIKSTVANINSIAEKISILNKQINVIELQGGYANELRDQRALLVDELSAIVPTTVTEVPVSNSNYPDMQLGSNYYTVKINGQILVSSYEYNELSCVARDVPVNQSDMEGMYEIVWADTGSTFHAGSEYSAGTLKGLLDVRDGNNAENFSGKITGLTDTTITVTENLSITEIGAMTMPDEGIITIEGADYRYNEFSFTTDEDGNIIGYTFTLAPESTLTPDQQIKLNGKKVEIGEAIDAKGIPYYMAQMNEFLRAFAQEFNDIMIGADNLYGEDVDFSFITAVDLISGEDTTFENIKGGTTYTSTMDCYFKLTCRNVSIDSACMKDPSLIATTQNINNGVDQYEIIDELLKLKSDTVMYRGGGADDFLQCMIADISVDTEEATVFSTNYLNVSTAIDNQRMSISGVDEDEEALDLVKFQNAYNLSSKMISVLTEIYDRLILETGV